MNRRQHTLEQVADAAFAFALGIGLFLLIAGGAGWLL